MLTIHEEPSQQDHQNTQEKNRKTPDCPKALWDGLVKGPSTLIHMISLSDKISDNLAKNETPYLEEFLNTMETRNNGTSKYENEAGSQ